MSPVGGEYFEPRAVEGCDHAVEWHAIKCPANQGFSEVNAMREAYVLALAWGACLGAGRRLLASCECVVMGRARACIASAELSMRESKLIGRV